MKWLKRHITNWIREDWDKGPLNDLGARNAVCDADSVLSFRVFSAIGGQVVEFKRCRQSHGIYDITTYVITSEQDLGEKIGKIVNMEMLK